MTRDFSVFIDSVSKLVWGPALLILVLGTGIFFTFAGGFFPIRKIGFIIKSTFGRIFSDKKAFLATATALGATVGTGNIVGVASAIAIGGAGAVFWMWVGAFFGMMLKFSEAALAVKFGSANIYIEKAFGIKAFSIFWCICCVFGSFGGGNMVQSHSAALVFKNSFGVPEIAVGAALAVLSAGVIFFGAKAITKASGFLVPFMAAIYIIGCSLVLFVFRENILSVFGDIFSSAFKPLSFGGGIMGLLLSDAMRVGITRGTFTNEAGMGSAAFAHAESKSKSPLAQGCWGIVEVFIDTVLVCTLTALVILCGSKTAFSENSAAEVFVRCFGKGGDIFLCFSMFLFALAAIIGWAFYGEKALFYITKSRFFIKIYRILFCFAVFCGSFLDLEIIWSFTDIFNGLMIFPNLFAMIFLAPEIFKIIKAPEP